MGSFASTCCVSGLSIEAGDPVRWFLLTENPYSDGGFVSELHGRWNPRTWPIRACYNDYGSIEDIEGGPVLAAILKGFQLDLIEVGTGDNSVHDGPVRKNMTFDQLLRGVIEGRVQVQRETRDKSMEELEALADKLLGSKRADRKPKAPAIPEYYPTLANVEGLLKGLVVTDGEFLVDEHKPAEEPVWVRVRWSSWGANYGKDEEFLTKARAVLEPTFATALCAGSGSYSHGYELRCFLAPGKEGDHDRRDSSAPKEKTLRVQQAMIREDVWKALISLPLTDYMGKASTIEDYREGAREYVAKRGQNSDYYFGRDILGAGLLAKDVLPFSVGLRTHYKLIEKVPEGFLDTAAEFTYLWHVLGSARHVWRPSDTAGPQFGEHEHHLRFFTALTGVAEAIAIEQKRRESE